MTTPKKILVAVTSEGAYRKTGYRTGLWLGELTHFWDVAGPAGFEMDIPAPRGGVVPLDPESLSAAMLGELGTIDRYRDRAFMDLLDHSGKLADARVEDYAAVYLTGGHGVMFDFPEALGGLVTRFFETGRVVSSVCHGAAGLLEARLSTGEPLVAGRALTGFSRQEEVLAQRDDAVPFSLEDRLRQLGADYRLADRPFAPYVVEDGTLITGQNPFSARGVAEAVVRRLQQA
ncbi:type 1 glutamine amidotransferase domain-containing protein [Amycolatopsis sp. NPDC026612]|uniref:type 1 glutamine amidotransferase domain-containing protein n=1 Tax=Amycolatopsis sp. NPDC026612 TaxID=3155466 RepID=UPI0033E6835F